MVKQPSACLTRKDWSHIMATHDHKTIAPSAGSELIVEHKGAAQLSAELPTTTVRLERRGEARMDFRQSCSYEVLEAIEEESVVIRQGEAFALNRSKEGMLLLMGQALFDKQLFEVQNLISGSGWTMNVFETRWAKPVPVESFGELYLVGCQRIFGPLPPSAVQLASE
jgi:hypothetical protein